MSLAGGRCGGDDRSLVGRTGLPARRAHQIRAAAAPGALKKAPGLGAGR